MEHEHDRDHRGPRPRPGVRPAAAHEPPARGRPARGRLGSFALAACGSSADVAGTTARAGRRLVDDGHDGQRHGRDRRRDRGPVPRRRLQRAQRPDRERRRAQRHHDELRRRVGHRRGRPDDGRDDAARRRRRRQAARGRRRLHLALRPATASTRCTTAPSRTRTSCAACRRATRTATSASRRSSPAPTPGAGRTSTSRSTRARRRATSAGSKLKTSQLALPPKACEQAYAADGYEQSVQNLSQALAGLRHGLQRRLRRAARDRVGQRRRWLTMKLNVGV